MSDKFNQLFSNTRLEEDLKGRTLRGGAVNFAAQPFKVVLTVGSTAVLARILTPEDFGLIAMVVVVTGFMNLFKELGLSLATVQKKDITGEQISTIFWINVALSLLITVVIAALSPVLVWFYGEPRLLWVTIALASGFMLQGLSIQHQALLRRNMRFGRIAAVELISLTLGIAAAIAAAARGAGYWSLVVKELVSVLLRTVLMWGVCPWVPSRPAPGSGVRPMISFGANFAGSQMFPFFSRNLDKLLIGWYWGAVPLGLYQNAYKLLLMPIQQINPAINSVLVPALSRLQEKPEQFVSYYQKAVMLMTGLGMPLVAFCFVAADDIIMLFLGSQWLESIPIFRALAGAAFVGTFNVAMAWVYIPLGRTDRLLRWNMFSGSLNVLAFIIAIPWGLIAVALTFSSVRVIVTPFALSYCYRYSPLRLKHFFEAISLPAFFSILSAVAAFIFGFFFLSEDVNYVLRLLFMLMLFIGCYLSMWLILPRGRNEIIAMVQTARAGIFANMSTGVEKVTEEAAAEC